MILFTALIGPHFVDWTSYRQTFERQASAYVGRPVTVAGKASVRLLPTPVLSFTDVNVGDPAAPDVKMERFRAEVELAPLLRGEIRVIHMTMERPVFHFDIARLAEAHEKLAGAWRVDAERISLERLEIAEGSALITDSRSGQEWNAEGIDAVVEANTLMGPGKVEANLALDGQPMSLSVAFGHFEGDGVTTKVTVRSPKYPVTLATDGRLELAADAPPKYTGNATVVGIAPTDSKAERSPWADFRASGGFALQATDLSIDAMQLSYGATERPLILQASGKLDFSGAPRFDVGLTARQIDLDRALGGSTDAPVAIEAALHALTDRLPSLPLPPIPGKLRIEAQGAVIGGGVIQSVAVDLSTGGRAWEVDGLSAILPGETEVQLKGKLGIAPEVAFKGHALVASRRPAAFASWWRGEIGSASKIARFALTADVDLQPGEQRLENLIVATGAGITRGAVDVRRFQQSGHYFVTLNLNADRADFAETRALAELFFGKTTAEKIENMTLSLKADVLSAGGVEAHSVEVEGGFEAGELSLRRLAVADLAGASIEATGSIRDPLGKPSGSIEASIKAQDLSGAAEFLANLAPQSRIVRRLKDAAPTLSPVAADVSAKADTAGGKLSLALTGSFAATHLSLQSEGTGSLSDLSKFSGSLKLHADGEDSGTVLRQLGFAVLPVRSSPLKLDADFEGSVAERGKLKLSGSIAGVDVTYDGSTAVQGGTPSVDGAFTAKSADIDPLLLFAGIASPGIGEGHAASGSGRLEYLDGNVRAVIEKGMFGGAPMSGTLEATFAPDKRLSGRLNVASVSAPALVGLAIGASPGVGDSGWGNTPFANPLPEGLALDLTLNSKTLDVGAPLAASDAKLVVQLAAGKLELDLASAGFAGGTLKGALSATIHDGEADLSLRGALSGGSLEQLVWERAGLPVASGKLDASFDLVGRGRSTAGVIATLSGSGSFAIDSGRLNGVNPEALTAVMAMAEGKDDPDEAKARETFARHFGSGALDVGRVAGSFAVSSGILNIPTVSMEAGATSILADATFDLNRLTLQSQWAVRAGEVGADQAQPYVPIRFSGDVEDPDRLIDIDPLLNLMRSRFLQRQLKQLETLEAERQRAQAEEAARKAEEQRLAAEAAQKAEEARRAAEAQSAAPDEPAATGATDEPVPPQPTDQVPTDPAPISALPTPKAPPVAEPIELVPQPAPAPAPAARAVAPPPVQRAPLPQYPNASEWYDRQDPLACGVSLKVRKHRQPQRRGEIVARARRVDPLDQHRQGHADGVRHPFKLSPVPRLRARRWWSAL